MIPNPLHVVCLLVGNRYPDYYVTRLQSMLERHCKVPFRLSCITDTMRDFPAKIESISIEGKELLRPNMRPTTNKLHLLNPDFLPFHEFLYLDVTLVIHRDMRPLLDFAFERREDLVVLKDWNYDSYNTSVMRVRHSESTRKVYEAFVAGKAYKQRNWGDQDFLTACIRDQDLESHVAIFPEEMVVAYRNGRELAKSDPKAAHEMLDNATIVKFFGRHKMHKITNPFFRLRLALDIWKHGTRAANFWLKELRERWR